ncbi:MAG: DUF1002 domain-containing protein [Lachnospiraceae bacterium]|nr:DUF1002 domain-containing protein [Lachnospiraceae bacterium]
MLVMLVCSIVPGQIVLADKIEEKPYLSLGADLKEAEKKTVLALLGVDENHLELYRVGQVTNAEEHEYLGDYIPANVIGTRALSSVLVTLKEKGHGIDVSTNNITYCTGGMYRNALATAGIQDAEVIVAGPFNITGTAALVGAMKAYEAMTGEVIDEETKDAATNELVATGELAENLGDAQTAEELIALIKEKVVAQDLTNLEDIKKVIEEACQDLQVNLSEQDRQLILDLMEKIKNLDIDVNQLKEQAKAVYNKLAEMGIDLKSESFWQSVKDFFDRIFDTIIGFFGQKE